MKFFLLTTMAVAWSAQAFAPLSLHQKSTNMVRLQNQQDSPTRTTTTRLHAVSALVKKAKEASLRQYVADGIEDDVMEQYKKIKEALEKDSLDLSTQEMGPLQQELTRRKGTITVIAEYKRKLAGSGYVKDVFEPVILSREFREFGASGIAVMADERMGGCTYEDLKVFVEDQRRRHYTRCCGS
jgi:indole-3-glycerol phosphate synthase